MTSIQQIFTFAFFLIVIASHEILLIEGRQPKAFTEQEFTSAETKKETENHHILSHEPTYVATKRDIPPARSEQGPGFGSSAATHTSDFRPTTPGNSPGIGHSFAGANVKPKSQGNAPSATYSVAGGTDTFRPTAPGHSPGVGHSFQKQNTGPNA